MGYRNLISMIVLGALAPISSLTAQQPASPGELVDRVVAVVGDSVVLQSDVEEELLRIAAAGQPLPEDAAELNRLRRSVLDSRIDDLILLQAADREGLHVSTEDVRGDVEREIAQRQRAVGGQRAFEQALQAQGLTVDEYRAMLIEDRRREVLVQQYLGTIRQARRPPPVTEEEIRAFFEEQRGSLGTRPASISFRQIVVPVRPTDEARAAAQEQAVALFERIRGGEDFEELARQYSDDPGSRQRGGDLGWFRAGQMVPDFERVAFALRPGDMGVVETSVGVHIIKLERIRGAERQARHILIRPEITDEDVDRSRELAGELLERIRVGESIAELNREYGDPDQESRVGPFPRDELPDPYGRELAGAQAGDVVGPVRLESPAGMPQWAIIRVTEVTEAGEFTLDDLRAPIQRQLEFSKLFDELVEELRRSTYVEIRL